MSMHVIVMYRQQSGQKLGEKTFGKNQRKTRSANCLLRLVNISMTVIYGLYKGRPGRKTDRNRQQTSTCATFCTILHHFSLFCTIFHHFSQFFTILHHFSLFCTILHHFSPFCTILHHFELFCTILHHVLQLANAQQGKPANEY